MPSLIELFSLSLCLVITVYFDRLFAFLHELSPDKIDDHTLISNRSRRAVGSTRVLARLGAISGVQID
jgi:hypothetical protein